VKTDDLIETLVKDRGSPSLRPRIAATYALVAGGLIAGIIFMLSMDPRPELNAEAGNGLVECRRRPNGTFGPIEKGEDSVTSGLHEPAAVAVENELDPFVVPCHHVEPPAVAEALRRGSRIDNVCEQD